MCRVAKVPQDHVFWMWPCQSVVAVDTIFMADVPVFSLQWVPKAAITPIAAKDVD